MNKADYSQENFTYHGIIQGGLLAKEERSEHTRQAFSQASFYKN